MNYNTYVSADGVRSPCPLLLMLPFLSKLPLHCTSYSGLPTALCNRTHISFLVDYLLHFIAQSMIGSQISAPQIKHTPQLKLQISVTVVIYDMNTPSSFTMGLAFTCPKNSQLSCYALATHSHLHRFIFILNH